MLFNSLYMAIVDGWKINDSGVFGKPDFVFHSKKLAIFIDGCFWHGCKRHYRRPKSNTNYWDAKKIHNMQRRRLVDRQLRMAGWRVMHIWEHDVRSGEYKKRLFRSCGIGIPTRPTDSVSGKSE